VQGLRLLTEYVDLSKRCITDLVDLGDAALQCQFIRRRITSLALVISQRS
jgi:hypothetical protein